MTVDLKNIVQKDQIERMQRRIEEAAKRGAAEKRALELEITTWRDKLADMSERVFAAEAVKTRQAARIARLRECLEWLDRRGGLGLDVHERIKKTLDETTERGPALDAVGRQKPSAPLCAPA